MKTTVNLIFGIIASLLFALPVMGQTYKEGDDSEMNSEKMTPQQLANLGIISAPNPKNATVQGNSVYVQQIGGYNNAKIQTRTSASEINLLQNGDYNDTDLDYTANTAVADLIQNGNSNRIKDFVNKPDADISLDLIQDGNYLNFEREGVNELTKSLKFRQTEASPTIIVRSFY